MTSVLEKLPDFIPVAVTIVLVTIGLQVARKVLDRLAARPGRAQFRNQLWMLSLTALGVLLILMALPMGDALRGQLLGFLGIVLSAALALSSTTFLGNAMAGVLLRVVRNFRIGDFISCQEFFGRVTERGLFHTEIQNEFRDLVTIPNLYLTTHPVTTTRSSGTIVSATVSLGYDVSRTKIEELLLVAAGNTGLQDPFVQILDLGDFSVTYRVAGLLEEVKQLLTTRSRLRGCMLDALHEGGIEIVSPNFMNQRVLDPDRPFIPRQDRRAKEPEESAAAERAPEAVVFDKADEAESIAQLRERWKQASEQVEALEAERKAVEDEQAGAALDARIEVARGAEQRLRARLAAREEKSEKEP
jgi:small-conductance mechanosensitive channel